MEGSNQRLRGQNAHGACVTRAYCCARLQVEVHIYQWTTSEGNNITDQRCAFAADILKVDVQVRFFREGYKDSQYEDSPYLGYPFAQGGISAVGPPQRMPPPPGESVGVPFWEVAQRSHERSASRSRVPVEESPAKSPVPMEVQVGGGELPTQPTRSGRTPQARRVFDNS